MRLNTCSSTDPSWFQIAVVQPAFDGRFVLLPEVEVAVRKSGSSLQPALQHSCCTLETGREARIWTVGPLSLEFSVCPCAGKTFKADGGTERDWDRVGNGEWRYQTKRGRGIRKKEKREWEGKRHRLYVSPRSTSLLVLPPSELDETYVVFDSGPLATLHENMTSYTKPEVYNVLHCRQRRTEPRQFGRDFWDMRADRQTDRQTGRQIRGHADRDISHTYRRLNNEVVEVCRRMVIENVAHDRNKFERNSELTCRQQRSCNAGVMRDCRLRPWRSRAAAFWTCLRGENVNAESNSHRVAVVDDITS